MTPADKLIALMERAIANINATTARAFEQQMRAILVRGHTAALIAATSESLGVSVSLVKNLSRAERADVKRAVEAQMPFLSAFMAAYPAMSEVQRAARALLYAGSVLATYNSARWGQWELTDAMIPGRQACGGRCGCQTAVVDNGNGTGTLTRTLGNTTHSCTECPPLAGDYAVTRRKF